MTNAPPSRSDAYEQRFTRFAELIADGASITVAAERLGIHRVAGSRYFRRMRDECDAGADGVTRGKWAV